MSFLRKDDSLRLRVFAFHPRLTGLQKLYGQGQLAIVHACGSPNTTRSHFDAQDYMESATPGMKGTTMFSPSTAPL